MLSPFTSLPRPWHQSRPFSLVHRLLWMPEMSLPTQSHVRPSRHTGVRSRGTVSEGPPITLSVRAPHGSSVIQVPYVVFLSLQTPHCLPFHFCVHCAGLAGCVSPSHPASPQLPGECLTTLSSSTSVFPWSFKLRTLCTELSPSHRQLGAGDEPS